MLDTIKTSVEIAFYVIGVLAACISFCEYRRNSRWKRAEWLFELYQRFYEDRDLAVIWRKVNDTGHVLDAKLDRLLSFFEFIAILRKEGQLANADVHDLFDYPPASARTAEGLARVPGRVQLRAPGGVAAFPRLESRTWATVRT